MKNLLRILAALLLVSVFLISCSDDDPIDAVDQLVGKWELVSFSDSDCDDSADNTTDVPCDSTNCSIVTFDGSKIIGISISGVDTFTFNYTKVNANTIETCILSCIQETIEIDGNIMTLTQEKDANTGCISSTKFSKL